MIIKKTRREMRDVRHERLRNKLKGTCDRPRLAVYRSSKHIYAQIIDDTQGRTLVAACSLEKGSDSKGSTSAGAASVGKHIARKAVDHGIKRVVFDRGGYMYHGRVAALARAAREGGLEF